MWVKKFFCNNFKFLNFFAGPGSWNFSKMTKFLYPKYEPKTHPNYPKCCTERELRLSWRFRVKKIFWKISNFGTFFAGPGSLNFSKITRSLYPKYEPKTHRNYPKCCSECIFRLSWLFQVKKFFRTISNIFNWFAGPASWNFSKITRSLYSRYEPKIHRNYPKYCSERELRLSWWFRVKKFFGKISNFWTFLQVRGHEIFQKSLGPYI